MFILELLEVAVKNALFGAEVTYTLLLHVIFICWTEFILLVVYKYKIRRRG
jgi:hypothetical protein